MAASSNLSISVSADTKPARQDIELLNASVRSLRKEVRDLSNEAQRTGTIMPRLPEAIKQLEVAEAQQKSFRTATRATTAAVDEASLSLAEMGKMLGGVAKASGIGIPGIKALRFGLLSLVGVEIVRGINFITDKITELSDASKKIGLDPGTIKQFGDAIADTGGKVQDAVPMLEKLVGSFPAEKKNEMQSWWGAANDAARDGRPLASDYARTLAELHINMQRYSNDMAGMRAVAIDALKALAELAKSGKIDDANRISVELLGKNWREAGGAVQRFIELAAQGAGATGPASKEAIDAALAYAIAVNALNKAWTDLLTTLATSGALTAVTELLKEASKTIETTAREIQGLVDAVKLLGTSLPGVTTTSSPETAGGFASGGRVRGPGSGTSDSILARLSNGEYVMRAAAVEHWGPRFMAALNHLQNPFGRYGTGGLVQTTPRFASGGMVSARTRDGAIVNLHFPGGQFQLHGDKAIVASLTREARRAGMLNAGRMPGALA